MSDIQKWMDYFEERSREFNSSFSKGMKNKSHFPKIIFIVWQPNFVNWMQKNDLKNQNRVC